MPNHYTGNVIFTAETEKGYAALAKFEPNITVKEANNVLGEDAWKYKDNFLDTFLPLVSKDGTETTCDDARDQWGSKWGIYDSMCDYESKQTMTGSVIYKIDITFQSAWCCPYEGFRRLADKYDLKLEGSGNEEGCCFHDWYFDDKYICEDYDINDVINEVVLAAGNEPAAGDDETMFMEVKAWLEHWTKNESTEEWEPISEEAAECCSESTLEGKNDWFYETADEALWLDYYFNIQKKNKNPDDIPSKTTEELLAKLLFDHNAMRTLCSQSTLTRSFVNVLNMDCSVPSR